MPPQNDSFQNDPVLKKTIEPSSFHAFKALVDADTNLTVVENRIKVLLLNQEKNKRKIANQANLLEKIHKARNEYHQNAEKIMEDSQVRKLRLMEQTKLNRERKARHQQQLSEVQNGIAQQKHCEYQLITEKSKQAEELIIERKKSEKEGKVQKRNKVIQQEEQIRESIVKRHHEKAQKILSTNQNEITEIMQKKAMKEQKMREMTVREMELLNKNSQSIAAYKEIKSKLDSLLAHTRKENKDCKHKLTVKNPAMVCRENYHFS